MARKLPAREVIVKLIVGAGQASPSPPVGPALGSKGVKSMDFCKEFNARTAQYIAGTPIPCRVTVRPDRSFHFETRTPPTATLLFAAAGVTPKKNKTRGAGNVPGPHRNKEASEAWREGLKGPGGKATGTNAVAGNSGINGVGVVSLKHVYEIAKIKREETRLSGLSLEGICRTVIAQAGSCGIAITP